MTQFAYTVARIVRNATGPKSRRAIRRSIELWLSATSCAPLQRLRVLGLKMAGATIGKNVSLGFGLRTLAPWQLRIGNNNLIGRRVIFDARGMLTIGCNCNISDSVAIWTAEHDVQSPAFATTDAPVVIGDRVWLCYGSVVLPGITIGDGAVVATGSVVTKNVPAFTIVGGVPAKVIGKRNENLDYHLGRHIP